MLINTHDQNKSSQTGQGLIEYAIVIILIAGITTGVLAITGTNVSEIYQKAVNALGNNPSAVVSPTNPA